MKRRLFLLIVGVVMVYAAGYGFPIKMKDDRGKELRLETMPKRIVSLVPSHTEILFALGVKTELAAVSDYCNLPPNAENLPRVGGFATASADKITELKPDLVLALGTIQLPLVKELEKRGLTVFWIYPRNVSQILDSFERIGQLTGKVSEARKLRNRVEKKINAVSLRLKGLKESDRPSVVRVMNIDPPGTVGSQSFQTDVFRMAGGRNAFHHVDMDYYPVEAGTLKTCHIDFIIMCAPDPERVKQLAVQPVWKELDAVKQSNILVMPCNVICRPGPRVGESIEQIARFLHPERF
jgi:iron complex transport system substrate-binding protein